MKSMIYKLQKLAFLLIVIVSLNSCTLGYFMKKTQQVSIVKDSAATILIDNKEPLMKNDKYILACDGDAKQITIKKEGYKTINKVCVPYRLSPAAYATVAINALPLGIILYSVVAGDGTDAPPAFFGFLGATIGGVWGMGMVSFDSKFQRFDKTIFLNKDTQILIPTRDSLMKEIKLNKVGVDIKPENSEGFYPSYKQYIKGKLTKKYTTKGAEATKIEDTYFSDELKQIIREQLQGIWSGFAESDSLPEFYSYKETLTSFLDRYNPKSEETKKGMIGELLSHILLSYQDNDLTSLSILKNKEEKSIKKGFDIIYCQLEENKLWYSEVKSGRSETGMDSSTVYNRVLLNRAKTGISAMIAERRNSLWESALIDVSLVIKESEGRLNLKQLLSNDAPNINPNQKKNVILISALYHNLIDEIDEINVSDFFEDTANEDIFEDVIIISIQKNTFETVANFLSNEITTA